MELIREIPNSSLAGAFDGEPMVQSFRVETSGRAWITTADALQVPGFGRPWVEGQLLALRAALGPRAFERALAAGVRLSPDGAALPALPLAA